MGGLIFLFAIGLWVALVSWLSWLIANRIPWASWRFPIGLLLFGLLTLLPILDELFGGRQFKQLCQENASIQINRATAVGRTVYLDQSPPYVVDGTWVPVVIQPWRFVDATTGETVVSYNTLRANGGRFLKITEGHVPLTFKGYCAPANRPGSIQTFKELGINYIEPPVKAGGAR